MAREDVRQLLARLFRSATLPWRPQLNAMLTAGVIRQDFPLSEGDRSRLAEVATEEVDPNPELAGTKSSK